jgi:FKBP-type peptidyl-prolyl cis-trans isomerase
MSVFLGVIFLALQASAAAEELRGLAYWDGLKHDVVETPSGLKYKAVITGKGKKPKANSKVNVHYRGLLLNGVTVDTSFDKDEPVTISLNKAIKAWKEGLQLMPVGSVFVFLVPPELAYGEHGTSVIPPNSTLIFEIELFGIK